VIAILVSLFMICRGFYCLYPTGSAAVGSRGCISILFQVFFSKLAVPFWSTGATFGTPYTPPPPSRQEGHWIKTHRRYITPPCSALLDNRDHLRHALDAVDAVVGNLGPLPAPMSAMLFQNEAQLDSVPAMVVNASLTCPKLGLSLLVQVSETTVTWNSYLDSLNVTWGAAFSSTSDVVTVMRMICMHIEGATRR